MLSYRYLSNHLQVVEEKHTTMVHGQDDQEEEEEEEEDDEEEEGGFVMDDHKSEQLRQMQEMIKTLQGSIEQLARGTSMPASRRASVASSSKKCVACLPFCGAWPCGRDFFGVPEGILQYLLSSKHLLMHYACSQPLSYL